MAARILARSGRVSIRRFRRSDQKERLKWPPYTDPLFTHLNYPLDSFIDRERWLLARITNTGRMYFAIDNEDGRLIGEMSLREIDPTGRTSRLGIHLASNRCSQGYGEEALVALLDHYFNDLRYEAMYLDVAAHNARALRLYEKLGFRHLSPFWRLDGSHLPLFTDERYEPIRKHFRRRGRAVECMFYDMIMTRDEYYRARRRA
jgi:RimJ/RimL family protein N-acetyltransferase